MPEHFYAIVSDIHGNYPALMAVEEDAKQLAIHEGLQPPTFICLGDVVDYGPQPNECMTWLARVKPIITVQGNHDAEACRPTKSRFHRVNEEYWSTALWTRCILESEHQATLRRWSLAKDGENGLGQFKFFHSDPWGKDDLYDTAEQVKPYFRSNFPAKLCFAAFGHLHYQMLWADDGTLHPVFAIPEEKAESQKYKRVNHWHTIGSVFSYLINPGSVGQPRFHADQPNRRSSRDTSIRIDNGPFDRRAAYMVFYCDHHDILHYQWRRVEYDRKETLRQMAALTWPNDLLKEDSTPSLPVSDEPDEMALTDEEMARIRADLPQAVKKLVKYIE